MLEASTLKDAVNKASPGDYVMTKRNEAGFPDWCVLTQAEVTKPEYKHWQIWLRKDHAKTD